MSDLENAEYHRQSPIIIGFYLANGNVVLERHHQLLLWVSWSQRVRAANLPSQSWYSVGSCLHGLESVASAMRVSMIEEPASRTTSSHPPGRDKTASSAGDTSRLASIIPMLSSDAGSPDDIAC